MLRSLTEAATPDVSTPAVDIKARSSGASAGALVLVGNLGWRQALTQEPSLQAYDHYGDGVGALR
jgi:hypothetical protein